MMPPTIGSVDSSATNASPIIVYSRGRDDSGINTRCVASASSNAAVPSVRGTIGTGSDSFFLEETKPISPVMQIENIKLTVVDIVILNQCITIHMFY